MPYIKNSWKDRAVQYPNRYTKSGETSTEVTLVASPGTVTEAGTPLNAANLNSMEEGIFQATELAEKALPSNETTGTKYTIHVDGKGLYLKEV